MSERALVLLTVVRRSRQEAGGPSALLLLLLLLSALSLSLSLLCCLCVLLLMVEVGRACRRGHPSRRARGRALVRLLRH